MIGFVSLHTRIVAYKLAPLLFAVVIFLASSCSPPPPLGDPTIVLPPGSPCDLTPGGTIPLSVTGVEGDVTYEWSASSGTVIPPKGSNLVTFTAADTSGQVIIEVIARNTDNEATRGQIVCNVVVTPTPTLTPTATFTPTPTPTPTDTPVPTETPTFTPTPPPLECRHPEITSYVFPQLQDVPNQRAFVGPLDIEETFLCQAVWDEVHSGSWAIRIEYNSGPDTFGWFGFGTLGGHDISQFSQLCFWAFAKQPAQAFRVKIKDTGNVEKGVDKAIPNSNMWGEICIDLEEFSDQNVNLSQVENINLGFEDSYGSAIIWVDDFELR